MKLAEKLLSILAAVLLTAVSVASGHAAISPLAFDLTKLTHGATFVTTQIGFEEGIVPVEIDTSTSPGDVQLAIRSDWCDSNWDYRKPITVTNNSGGVLTNYQVNITINTQELISAKMQSDGADIRFTQSDGTAEIYYWIESGINTTATDIWTKVPSIPTGDSTIYIYYGNSGASAASSESNTFPSGSFDAPYANWSYRMAIEVTENSGSTLTNYQVPITLDAESFNYSKARPGYQDVRFTQYNAGTDTETEIPYWLSSNKVTFEDFNDISDLATSNMGTPTTSNGIMSFTSTSDDSFYTKSVSLDTAQYPTVEIRCKVASGGGTGAQFYWNNGNGWSETYQLNFNIIADGAFHTYFVDMTADSDWTGTLTDLRHDPVIVSGVACEIDYIRFVPVDADFWVNVPEIPASSTATVYMYYGNSEASAASDGDATFEFFDDATGTYSDKWTNIEGTGSYATIGGKQAISLGSTTTNIRTSSYQSSGAIAIDAELYATELITAIQYYQDSSPAINEHYHARIDVRGGEKEALIEDSGFSGSETDVFSSASTWVTCLLTRDQNANHKWYVGGSLADQKTSDTTYSSGYLTLSHHNSGTGAVANLRVRKYASPEPTVNMGVEESTMSLTDYFGGTAGISSSSNVSVSGGAAVMSGMPYYDYAESESISTTTSTSWQDKTTLTFTPSSTTSYLIVASGLVAQTSTLGYRPTIVRMTIDGTEYMINRFVRTSGGTENEYYGFAANNIVSLDNTEHTIKIQYAASYALSSYTAKIRDARIVAYKVEDYHAAVSDTESSTSSTSYQDKTTLTFSPESEGDYLIIATADLSEESSSHSVYAQLTYDGSSQGEMLREPTYYSGSYPKHFYTYATMRKLSLDTSSHTFKIQYKTENSSYDAYIKNARIAAIRLDDFEYSESESESSTTATSYQDKTTLTFTPSAQGDYMIIASALIQKDPSTYAVLADFDIDGTAYGEMTYTPKDATDYVPFFVMKTMTLDASSHTIKIRYRSELLSGDALIKNARIIAIPLAVNASADLTSVTIPTDTDTRLAVGTQLSWNDTEPSGTDLEYQLYYLDGIWRLIPDDDLFGNSAGFDTSPINISSVKTDYEQIRIKASFTSDGTDTPTLSDWTVTYRYREYNATEPTTANMTEQVIYYPSGTIASKVLDTGKNGATWTSFNWDETLASGADITFEVRASDISFLMDAVSPSWTAVGGTSPVTSGLPTGQYQQWRATILLTLETPALEKVNTYYTW